MKKSIQVFILLVVMGLSMVKTSAANVEYELVSENEAIQQEEFEKECMVFCEIPYSYSETIPKEPTKEKIENVQTGDESIIMLWIILLISSVIGMKHCSKKMKEE